MSNAADMTALTRSAVVDMIAREERRTGSRMAAYAAVARAVGASASWVRKFASGHVEAKEPTWSIGWNIISFYRRLCDRVEGWEHAEIAKRQDITRQIDAIMESISPLAQAAARDTARSAHLAQADQTFAAGE